jgi:hypothetical protein
MKLAGRTDYLVNIQLIFYIKPQTISVVKCNDIALNSCAVLLSFFVIDGMEASY